MAGAGSILFACNMNSVRSPMAEALAKDILGPEVHIESCGVFAGILDPFVARVLEEEGIPIPSRDPQTFAKVEVDKFDHVIALTPEAAAEARRAGAKVTYWDTPNPTDVRGSDLDVLAAYRTCLHGLRAKIKEAFGEG
ncbi:arsenate-mycothiol transferase ArsC [Parvularcula marina]|uniref:Low molecular weight phosphatase family protein n=1 Tax=Parvularcula marina TaxID=2292771 RepID=A0A371RHC3_9PROT|nr:low molecular weight phosphatase family protein [Parvularcula marina]RFB04848.1 low molecular weight phosphatase family protein [Parvularcula marina]